MNMLDIILRSLTCASFYYITRTRAMISTRSARYPSAGSRSPLQATRYIMCRNSIILKAYAFDSTTAIKTLQLLLKRLYNFI